MSKGKAQRPQLAFSSPLLPRLPLLGVRQSRQLQFTKQEGTVKHHKPKSPQAPWGFRGRYAGPQARPPSAHTGGEDRNTAPHRRPGPWRPSSCPCTAHRLDKWVQTAPHTSATAAVSSNFLVSSKCSQIRLFLIEQQGEPSPAAGRTLTWEGGLRPAEAQDGRNGRCVQPRCTSPSS